MPNGRNNGKTAQLELPEFRVFFPRPVMVPQGNGYFVNAGKPMLVQMDDECGLPEAAQILGLSQRRVNEMCDAGVFVEGRDWRQPGGEGGKIFIKRSVVIARSGRPIAELKL